MAGGCLCGGDDDGLWYRGDRCAVVDREGTGMSDIEVMIAYLQLKIRQRDWHGVADAANDIRVMEAKEKKDA